MTSPIMNTHPQGTAASIHAPGTAQGTPQAEPVNLGEAAPPYADQQANPLNEQQQYLLHQMQELLTPMQQELAE